jgi:sugar lactone lactonase YvrE
MITRESVTLLAGGFCFGEGPRWFEGLLWFSDMLGEAVHTVTLDGAMTTLPTPGHAPSGLGFCPDGCLLVVSTEKRQVLHYDGEDITGYADLSELAPANLGDMVIDEQGRAYVVSQAREIGVIIRIDRDGSSRVVAADLDYPNGIVITADGATLIVAESVGRRLTAFSIDGNGDLGDRRVFAEGLDSPPDGITLDADGGVWASMTLGCRFDRIEDGGTVTDSIAMGERIAIACTLGGPERRTLFLLSSTEAYPERLIGTKASRLDAVVVDVPGAGWP